MCQRAILWGFQRTPSLYYICNHAVLCWLGCSSNMFLYSLWDGCYQYAEEKTRLPVWIQQVSNNQNNLYLVTGRGMRDSQLNEHCKSYRNDNMSCDKLIQKRMHYSRMHTDCGSNHLGGVCLDNTARQKLLGRSPWADRPGQIPRGSYPRADLYHTLYATRTTIPHQTHLPVDIMTHACENITFPTTLR